MFAAPGVKSTSNSSWWMVVRENDSGQILLSEGDIRFCDFDQLPILLQHDNTWIPVMFFGSNGEFTSVDPASPYSFVSTSANDLQVVNKDGGIMTLNQHVNDAALHKERILTFPFVGNVTALKINKEALRIDSPTAKSGLVGVKSVIVGANGTALYGTSSTSTFNYSDVPFGVGIYVDGDGADMLLENGKIGTLSGDGAISFGNGDIQNKMVVTGSESNEGAISVDNIQEIVGAIDFDNMGSNPIGIYGGYNRSSRVGIMGVANNNVGILANGVGGDVYLKHGTIVSWDLKGGELYIDGDKVTQNGVYAPDDYV